MKTDKELEMAFAVLISSTKTKKRKLPLTEIANWIEVAVKKLGSYKTVSDRIGLSEKMLRQFTGVSHLTKPTMMLFQKRKIDSVDAVTHLGFLLPREQDLVARMLSENSINTIDVRAIAQMRKHHPEMSIRDIAKKVVESKTKKHYIFEFVVRGGRTKKNVEVALSKHLKPDEIVALTVDGAYARLVLSGEGKKKMFSLARKMGVTAKQVIPSILVEG